MVRREPGGYPRRRALLASVEVQKVGALPGIEGESVFIQHLADPAHPFERLRGLALEQGLLESGFCTLPVAAAEGRPARIERGARIGSSITLQLSMNQPREIQ